MSSLRAFGVLVGSALLAEVLGAAFGLSPAGLVMLGLALLTIVICGLPFVIDEAQPLERRHTTTALLAVAFMLGYAFPVFVNYLPSGPIAVPGNIGTPVPLNRADTIAGQALAIFALLCAALAYGLPIGRWVGRSLPSLRRDWSLVECEVVGLAMLAVGWTITTLGVVGLIPRSLGSGVINTLAAFHIYATVLFTYAFIRYRSPTALLLIPIVVVPSSLLGFLAGSKLWALQPLALVVVTGMLCSGRIRFRWIASAVLGLTILYPTAIFYRAVILNGNTLPVSVPLSHPAETYDRVESFLASQHMGETLSEGFQSTGGRLDMLGPTSVILRDTPKVSPFQHGRTLALFVYSFFPRALWPNKPTINIGQWITDTYGPGPGVINSTGPTLIGDLYLNFGLWSVAAGILVCGLALRSFHEWTLARARTAPAVLLCAVLLSRAVQVLEGNVAGALGVLIFAFVPIVAIHLVITILSGAPRRISSGSRPAARESTPL